MSKISAAIPNLFFEKQMGYPARIIVGLDEVGRGCIAGPVVAGAAIVPEIIGEEQHSWLKEVKDSKLLSPQKRSYISPLLKTWLRGYSIGVVSVEEIDRINIFHASYLAMTRALENLCLKYKVDHVLVDGKWLPKDLKISGTAIIKGDQKSISIACASILAKVWRDDLMEQLDGQYPGYGLAQHKGYPTRAHTQALKIQGVSPIHRRTFAPVMAVASLKSTHSLYAPKPVHPTP